MGGRHLGKSRACRAGQLGVAAATATALSALSTLARAQALPAPPSPAPLVPIVTPIRGDDLFATRNGLPLTAAFAPLRLSLTGGLFPQAPAFSACDSRTDASGNSAHGFATQYYSFLRLTPQLVLHGFSTAGCALDAGMGGGLTYAVPLRKSWWLVPSVGAYALPTALVGATGATVTSSARVDLVKQLAWGRTLSLGVGARLGAGVFNAVNFGGSF